MVPNDVEEFDRRKMLGKLAAAGAVGWVAPVIISSSPAAAGVFTAKCAPGAISATNSFVRTACFGTGSTITITIGFSGPCPCGGTKLWCAQKNTPTPVASSATATLTLPGISVPVFGSTTISGRVALGCTDRDGDTQFARDDWSMTASDNGNPCRFVVNTISAVSFSNRTVSTSPTCPSLAAGALLVAPAPRSAGGTRLPD